MKSARAVGALILSACSLKCVFLLGALLNSFDAGISGSTCIICAEILVISIVVLIMDYQETLKILGINAVTCFALEAASVFAVTDRFSTGIFYLQGIAIHCLVLFIGLVGFSKMKAQIAAIGWAWCRQYTPLIFLIEICIMVFGVTLLLENSGFEG